MQNFPKNEAHGVSQAGCAAASQMGGVWSSARTRALKPHGLLWCSESGLCFGRDCSTNIKANHSRLAFFLCARHGRTPVGESPTVS